MSELMTYLNGEVMPHREAVSELAKREINSAGGFYDAEQTFKGQAFKLRAHLDRLYSSLDSAQIDPGISIDEMESATTELLEANRPLLKEGDEFTLSQIVTKGVHTDEEGAQSANVLILCEMLDFSEFAESYVYGVRVITPTTYAILRRPGGGSNGHDRKDVYPLMTDVEGNITECVHANFMFVKDGRIKLPDRRNVLPGISMATVLELADSLDIPVDEGGYSSRAVYECDEALISSTRVCILPVRSLNGYALGSGVPGEITSRLTSSWSDVVGVDVVQQAMNHRSLS